MNLFSTGRHGLSRSLLNPETHVDALRILSARALQDHEFYQAFRYADRICRLTAHGDVDALLLRSDALRGAGRGRAAAKDLARAYTIDPINPHVGIRKLQSLRGSGACVLIRSLLSSPRLSPEIARIVLAAAAEAGLETISALSVRSTHVTGWLAWRGEGEIRVALVATNDETSSKPKRSFSCHHDPHHRFALAGWHVADCHITGCQGDDWRGTEVAILGPKTRRLALDVVASVSRSRVKPSAPDAETTPSVCVIVPLYGDHCATRRCLQSVARQKSDGTSLRCILVQDNPRDLALTKLAEGFAGRHGWQLLVNEANLGFAASVNRALSQSRQDDVLILNSDADLPIGAIARLKTVATPGVGTITPLSNNGEETSFPSPFLRTRIGSRRKVGRLSAVAAEVNHQKTVPLVNGVGFCLYVTRDCLDTIGRIPEIYARGYYEDVDFCLLAKNAGFRNLCATDVYVGHKGGSSFRGQKRALVVRNERIVSQRFPSYERDSLAFLAADPLSSARAAIERETGPSRTHQALVLSRARDVDKIGGLIKRRQRARILAATWSSGRADRIEVRSMGPSDPQSLAFDLQDGHDDLIRYLVTKAGINHVVMLEACAEQIDLVAALKKAGLFVDLLLEDGWIMPSHEAEPHVCGQDASSPCRSDASGDKASAAIVELLGLVDRIQPTNTMAAALLSNSTPREAIAPLDLVRCSDPVEVRLGVLYPIADAASEDLILRLTAATAKNARLDLVVLGTTMDDLRLMRQGAFVSGSMKWGDVMAATRSYAIDVLLMPYRSFGFGLLQRLASPLPQAYFNWGGSDHVAQSGNLALDPHLCAPETARRIVEWCRSGRHDAA